MSLMKNKVLVELIVPEIEERYDIYIPVSKKIGSVIQLLQKSVFELSDGDFIATQKNLLYSITGEKYDINATVKDTNIRNGSKIVLM